MGILDTSSRDSEIEHAYQVKIHIPLYRNYNQDNNQLPTGKLDTSKIFLSVVSDRLPPGETNSKNTGEYTSIDRSILSNSSI